MAYFWELCDLKDSEDTPLLIQAAGLSLQNSEYVLVGGIPSSHYFDLDQFLRVKNYAAQLVELLVKKIHELKNSPTYSFNKIALIDKGEGGPVGLILLMGLLSSKLEEEIVIIRPKRLLLRASIKGTINDGDKFLILSDVATTGRTIFLAYEKINAFGGVVPLSLVVFDRRQGATQNLFVKGIQLLSLTSIPSLIKDRKDEIENEFHRKIKEVPQEMLLDFSGRSRTIASAV